MGSVQLHPQGLGFDAKKVRVKLVPYDFAATLATCADVAPSMGSPFDGTNNQVVVPNFG